MFYIGEFSKMGKTTVKTLHHYDRIGLLASRPPWTAPPATACTPRRQLADLHRIQALRQAGLSVDEVAAIEAGADPQPHPRAASRARSNGNSPRARTASRASHSCSRQPRKGYLHGLPGHHQGPAQLRRVLQEP